MKLLRMTDTDLRNKRSEEHTSELQSQSNLVCRLLLEKKKKLTAHPVPTVESSAAIPVSSRRVHLPVLILEHDFVSFPLVFDPEFSYRNLTNTFYSLAT